MFLKVSAKFPKIPRISSQYSNKTRINSVLLPMACDKCRVASTANVFSRYECGADSAISWQF